MNVIKRLMSRRSDIGLNFSGKEVTAVSSGRFSADGINLLTLQPAGVEEHRLYDNLRYSVPIVDAALQKIIRLTGGYRVICSDPRWQEELDRFVEEVPVGIGAYS